MKESVQKFDLEAAFKALDEVEIPVVKGIRPNRENLQEKFTRKLTSEVLVEDYFDVSDTAELEQASEEREAEIAKAKLARIEKIVDLDAETEEDLLPSYVGKLIIQCPQCMTLFYKKEEDIERSDENPEVVNLNEPCQHCGNSSGYTLIGKVDQVGEEEASQYDVEDFEDELNLDFEEPAEEEEIEAPAEETEEVAAEEEEELSLEPIEEEEEEEVKESLTEAAEVSEDEAIEIVEEEPVEEASEEEAIEEILTSVEEVKEIAAEAGEAVAEVIKEEPEVESEEIKGITDEVVEVALEVEEEEEVSEEDVKESLTEDVEINKQMELYNEFVKYLQKMVEQDEEALEEAKKLGNKEVIAAIEKRLENSKAELKAALPTTVKDEVSAEELPTPEEAEMEAPAENKEDKKEKKESLTESLRTWTCWYEGHDIGTVEAETEEKAQEEMMAKYPEYQYNNTDWGVSLEDENLEEAVAGDLDTLLDSEEFKKPISEKEVEAIAAKYEGLEEEIAPGVESEIAMKQIVDTWESVEEPIEDLDEAAPQAASQLKRKLSATEIIVKELREHPLFKGLSTRTVQRVLLPYYIEQMGRENLSAQAMIDFFDFEGFAPYVLDNFATMDPLARKELLKADAKFMGIFNAWAAEYDAYPATKDELEAGEDEFGYAFNVIFGLEDGQIYDAEVTGQAVAAFGKMYVTGKFDKAVAEADHKLPVGWENIDDFDEESFDSLTEKYLKEVYSNVKSFNATSCDLKEDKLVVEGKITFNSGKSKTTTFVYEAKEVSEDKLILEGLNADFATEKAFVLNCKVDTAKCLIVESLSYKYSINETLVEGLLK